MHEDSFYNFQEEVVKNPRRAFRSYIAEFSPFEKLAFFALILVLTFSFVALAGQANKNLLTTIPTSGGNFREGVIGSPRYINPVLADSDVDRDLTSLIYSGLMKADVNGGLVYDLAKSHTVSEDGLEYTFFLRDDVEFHDGERVTADDVLFTIKLAQNPLVKSTKRGSWDGVLVEKVSDTEIIFTLKQPYAPFIENLTIGILPEHIWGEAHETDIEFSDFNTRPIGSGPYAIEDIRYDDTRVPVYYTLKSFDNYALGKPHIETIRVFLYPNEELLVNAYVSKDIDSIHSVSANSIAYARLNLGEVSYQTTPLPRVFGVFFNQNQAAIFAHNEVRRALNVALDKERIVRDVLSGFGTVIDSPIPPGVLPASTSTTEVSDEASRRKQAIDILEKNGWKVNEEDGVWEKKTNQGLERLSFSIATSDISELKAVASVVEEEWRAIGAEVEVKVFEIGDLNQNVIRPRKYDSLLFGEIVGRELDLYAFWHSSQRNDPGLNIALYANITADAALEKARVTQDKDERLQHFKTFEDEIKVDVPAVFMYSPDFIYVTPKDVEGIELGSITTPSDRFLNVHEWYKNTDSVWNFFVN